MGTNSADPAFNTRTRINAQPSVSAAHRRSSRPRLPSTSGYMAVAGATAAALFFVLWWMLHSGEYFSESPWVPAGLAASVVMLVAAAAREVVIRRAWTRYMLEQGSRYDHPIRGTRKHGSSGSLGSHSAALRALNKKSAEADAAGVLQPEVHLEAYHSCKEYLAGTDEALRSTAIPERRLALRAGQEHARALQKRHLLTWARGASRALTHEAQRRVQVSDKIETATRALDVIDAALKLYPDEPELHQSEIAVHEFIASVKVSRWVEMAERAAFKGQYARAIDRYRDALFYLSRETMKEEARAEAAERITREIELLRAHLMMGGTNGKPGAHAPRRHRERTG